MNLTKEEEAQRIANLQTLTMELCSMIAQGIGFGYVVENALENVKVRKWLLRVYMYCMITDRARLIRSVSEPTSGQILSYVKTDLKHLKESLDESKERLQQATGLPETFRSESETSSEGAEPG